MADDDALIDWLFSINYPFDMSWPLCPPPVDHRKLAKVWNQRDDWDVADDDAYLTVCSEAAFMLGLIAVAFIAMIFAIIADARAEKARDEWMHSLDRPWNAWKRDADE